MTDTQLSAVDASTYRLRYEPLLAERTRLGRLYADHLCHLREATPQALLLFQRLLHVDAALARFRRYDVDLFRVVIPAEDARLHQPPDVPRDHQQAPCNLCLRAALQLDPNVVLPAQARRAG